MTIIAASVAHSRVEAGAGVLGLLYEAGHVLEEEVVHVLLVHVAQLRVAAHVYLQRTRLIELTRINTTEGISG